MINIIRVVVIGRLILHITIIISQMLFSDVTVKPRQHQQQCRRSIVVYATSQTILSTKSNVVAFLATMSNEVFVKFFPFDKVETN